VPSEASTWAHRTVDVLRSGLGEERPVPNIYLPDGRESAYDVSAAVVALVLGGQHLTADEVTTFVEVAQDSWDPRRRTWRSGAVPSSATASMVLAALDTLEDQSADQVSDVPGAAHVRAIAQASAPGPEPTPGPKAIGRAVRTVHQELMRQDWITPRVAGLLDQMWPTGTVSAPTEAPAVLAQVAHLVAADRVTPHPVAFALVTQALHRWDLEVTLSSHARAFLDEILRFRAMRSVAVGDGLAYAEVVTTLRLLGSGSPPGPAHPDRVKDSSADIALRLAFGSPVPRELVERDARGLHGSDLDPDHVVLLAKAGAAAAWTCGPELARVLLQSMELISGDSGGLAGLSSFRVAQAWWVAAAAARCRATPDAPRVTSRLTDLVENRITSLSRGGAVSAMERALSLSALLEAACSGPAPDPTTHRAGLVGSALAVTNASGGAGYRPRQIDPFVTQSVSRILSFADHGCEA
jgi:hypothetical protein